MTTQPAAPELVELTKSEQTLQGVAAAALGNLLAGVGVGIVVGVILHIVGAPGYLRWGGYAALLGWGAIMAVWFAQDETSNWWHRRELAINLAAAQETIDWADDELATLRYQLTEARLENGRLRQEVAALRQTRNYTPATPPASDPAMMDAQRMIELYFAAEGQHPSKRVMAKFGWSEDRHAHAMRLLASRGVVTILPGNKVRWNDDAAAPALQRLAGDETLPLDWRTGGASASQKQEAD